jgi:pimeloyl-ACP methyl ester carboxylesterase
LVQGAWHGSWCWKRVRRALQALGHDVFTPTLTGLADRHHLLSREVNLQTHIDDVANLIRWEELSDVVLCGHSYGGCVISGVADLMSERIGALVYLDAFVLKDGQSLHDTLPPETRDGQLAATQRVGEGWRVPPIPAEAFKVNENDRAWVDLQCTPQPLATFQQRIHFRGGLEGIKDVTFIWANGYAPSPFPPFYEQAKANGWKTRVIACGHDVMLDMPEALTQDLLSMASLGGH